MLTDSNIGLPSLEVQYFRNVADLSDEEVSNCLPLQKLGIVQLKFNGDTDTVNVLLRYQDASNVTQLKAELGCKDKNKVEANKRISQSFLWGPSDDRITMTLESFILYLETHHTDLKEVTAILKEYLGRKRPHDENSGDPRKMQIVSSQSVIAYDFPPVVPVPMSLSPKELSTSSYASAAMVFKKAIITPGPLPPLLGNPVNPAKQEFPTLKTKLASSDVAKPAVSQPQSNDDIIKKIPELSVLKSFELIIKVNKAAELVITFKTPNKFIEFQNRYLSVQEKIKQQPIKISLANLIAKLTKGHPKDDEVQKLCQDFARINSKKSNSDVEQEKSQESEGFKLK